MKVVMPFFNICFFHFILIVLEFDICGDHPGSSAVVRRFSNDNGEGVSRKARIIRSEQDDTAEDNVHGEENISPESPADLCSTFEPHLLSI